MFSLKSNDINRFFIIVLLFIAYGLYSQYLVTSIISGIALALIIQFLWVPYSPPALLFFFIFHWIQVFTAIILADHQDEKLTVLFSNYDIKQIIDTTYLQIVIMAGLASLFLRNEGQNTFDNLKAAAEKLDIRKIIIAFGIATVIFPTLIVLTASNGSLNQLMRSISVFRSILLILLIFILFLRKTQYSILIIVIIIVEFLLGFASYFSSFKEIIFYILIVYLTVNNKVRLKTIVFILPAFALLSYVMIFWSYTKSDYREFLNGGSRKQEIVVSKSQAADYLFNSFNKFNENNYKEGLSALLDRLQYISNYALIQERVPLITPHTDGELTNGALQFLFIPRVLSKGKGILDPSVKTTYYTGVPLATAEEGTSISMGYFSDFYIDYGVTGMYIPLIIVALLLGWGNSYLLRIRKYNVLLTYSIVISFIMGLGTFESDIIYFLGCIRNAIVIFIVGYYFIFSRLDKYIYKA